MGNTADLQAALNKAGLTDIADKFRKFLAGDVLVAGRVVGEVTNETPNGTITAFTVDSDIFAGSESVDEITTSTGATRRRRRTTDYTVSGKTLTFGVAPTSGTVLVVDYLKA